LFFEKVFLPLVKKALQSLSSSPSNVRHLTLNTAAYQSEIKELIDQEIDKRNSTLQSEITTLIDSKINQLNEASAADFDDREARLQENERLLKVYLEDNVDTIQLALQRTQSQIQNLNKIADALKSNITSFPGLIQSLEKQVKDIDTDYKQAVNKSRTDTAAVVKNTREKLTDLDDKLDAFIDTISEKLVAMRRSRA
jgi:chromosome segregation ATPase